MKKEVKTLDEFITALSDIFVDALKEECSKEDTCEKKCESTCDSSCSEDEDEETCENDNILHLSDSIISTDENTYFVSKVVDNKRINDELMLTFAHQCDCGAYVPGITEQQLLTILLYKNRTNIERYNKIKSLLA